MLTSVEQEELLELARWITKCPSMVGPAGSTAYLIKPEVMTQLKLLVLSIEINANTVLRRKTTKTPL